MIVVPKPRVLATGVALVLAAALSGACDTNPAPVTVFCKDFSVGTDLSAVTFGVSGGAAKPYLAFAQAVSDMAVMGSTLLDEVESSCRDIALRFGANPDDPRLVTSAMPARVGVWCDLAAEGIAKKHDVLRAAKLTMWFTAPGCVIDTAYQSVCEGRCRDDLACAEAPTADRCKAEDLVGACDGRCTGSCEGSEGASATCDGSCTGSCDGECLDEDTQEAVKDFTSGSVCHRRCVGKCSASCTFAQGTEARCDSPCRGGCEGTLASPSCAGDLAPPKCSGDVDCQRCCKASAAARASCDGGALGVSVATGTGSDPTVPALVQALERNLPTIFLTARGRGETLKSNASSLVDAAGHVMGHDDLGQEGAACGLLIAQTGVAASDNLTIALDGANRVANAMDAATKP